MQTGILARNLKTFRRLNAYTEESFSFAQVEDYALELVRYHDVS